MQRGSTSGPRSWRVAERGSEPARFAFQVARVLFSDIPELDAVLRSITRYPVEGKAERIARFVAAHRKKKRALLGQRVIVRFREGHNGVDGAP